MIDRTRNAQPKLSCTGCMKRRIKCDRIKPCTACSVRGVSTKCTYAWDNAIVKQAFEIKRFRRRIEASEARSRRLKDRPTPVSSVITSRSGSVVSNADPTMPHQFSSLNTVRPSITPTIQAGLMAQFIAKTCPPFATRSFQWMLPIAQASAGSSMLWTSLSAVAFLDVARHIDNQTYLAESQRQYGNAVATLRRGLVGRGLPPGFTGVTVLYTMTILGLYEIVSFHDPLSWSLHIDGLAIYLQQHGHTGLLDDIPESIFNIIRLFEIVIKTVRRQRSFLASESWKPKILKAPANERGPLSKLLDVAIYLPGLFEESDLIDKAVAAGEISLGEETNRKKALWKHIDQMERRLNKLVMSDDELDLDSPVDDTKNNNSLHVEVPDSHALATCINTSCRLVLTRIDSRPWKPSDNSIVEKAMDLNSLCLKISQGYSDLTSGLIMLFSLRSSFHTFPDNHPGRVLTMVMLASFAQKFGLRVAKGIITMFPIYMSRQSGTPTEGPGLSPVTPMSPTDSTLAFRSAF